jgi:hypothetical protein
MPDTIRPRCPTHLTRLADLAIDQLGLVTRRQAEQSGIPRRTFDHAVGDRTPRHGGDEAHVLKAADVHRAQPALLLAGSGGAKAPASNALGGGAKRPTVRSVWLRAASTLLTADRVPTAIDPTRLQRRRY